MSQVPASIFRAYDIRGIVDETLTEDGVRAIGQSIGSEAAARGESTVPANCDCEAFRHADAGAASRSPPHPVHPPNWS